MFPNLSLFLRFHHKAKYQEQIMSTKKEPTEEEKRINRNSFIIGIFIAMAFIALFTILFYAGLLH